VAHSAGVDPSIVSRVLNGDAGRVSPQTRERIVAAATTLGYRPNALARSLSLGRTLTIGVLAPSLTNPGYAEMLAGIEEGAVARGYVLLHASTHDDNDAMLQQIARFENRVDGIIMASARRGSPAVAELENSHVPFIMVNRAGGKRDYSVIGDDTEAARTATAHLISLGHERIGYVTGPDDIDTLVRRLAGYRAAMTMARLSIDADWIVPATLNEPGGAAAARALLALPERRRPTAIFFSTISLALGGVEAARELRFNVPADLSVVSFDDSSILRHLAVPLTAMRMPDHAMGLMAVELLHERIEGHPIPHLTRISKRPELIVRASTSPPPSRRAKAG
jgi:LacI family transcriptional regulator